MSTYVMADIHGEYDAYREMLDLIRFSPKDTLYVLGDLVDRGPKPMEVVLDLMARPNAVCLAGNHELMALTCLTFLNREITEDSIEKLDGDLLRRLLTWQLNGSDTTVAGFRALTPEKRLEVLDFMGDLELYAQVRAGGRSFLLVHAGLGNFSPDRPIWDYSADEVVWERPDYTKPYFPDVYTVTGHTPTLAIDICPDPGHIFRLNNHIAIDCGAAFGGRLGCLCLDTDEEFYTEPKR